MRKWIVGFLFFCAWIVSAEEVLNFPALIDFGREDCFACAEVAPILEELKSEYEGRLRVEYVEVAGEENRATAARFDVCMLPTQLFVDRDGKVVFRHEGFYSKKEMLAAFSDRDVSLVDSDVPETVLSQAELLAKVVRKPVEPAKTDEAQDEISLDGVVVYYLTAACRSGCSGDLEDACYVAVEEKFGEGAFVWENICIEEPESVHFLEDYTLDEYLDFTRGVCVVSLFKEGALVKFVALEDLVWFKDDVEMLDEYVRTELESF